MGLQVSCPMCGMWRPLEKIGPRDLRAKKVESLGGNRGFEHTPVDVPSEVEREIQSAIETLHRRYVMDPPVQEMGGSEATGEVQEEIEEEIEEAVTQNLEQERSEGCANPPETGVETEDSAELDRVRREIQSAAVRGAKRAEIDPEIDRAVVEEEVRRAIEDAM